MPQPALLVVTGASGVGKTTLVRGLADRSLPGVRCHSFDSIGVPSPEEMTARFGSGELWQNATTRWWLERLAKLGRPGRLEVLDGQVRPSEVRQELAHSRRFAIAEILLVDCTHEVRERRLREDRQQPELATVDMVGWAAYLRGQTDALGLPRLDTSTCSVAEGIDALERHARALLARAAATAGGA